MIGEWAAWKTAQCIVARTSRQEVWVQGFEYALILLSVLVGLGLSDVAASLHKLLGLGRSVRWDGRVIISVALVVETTVRMWFDVWTLRSVPYVLTFGFYLSLVIEFMLL